MIQLGRHLSAALLSIFLIGAAGAADSTYTIAVIPKGTTHEYWKSVHAGAVKAREELRGQGINVNVIWKGPFREDDRDQQIQVVENFMIQHVSGIVLAPLDSQALVRPVANSAAAHVPVVIIDSSLKSDKFVRFVAPDKAKGGRLAAERLGQLLGGKGNVILLRYAVGSASTEARESGFLTAMTREFPDIKIISSDQHCGATRELAYQASQNLLNRFRDEVNGVFCPCEPPTVAMCKALRDFGKGGGKVKMVGFDAASQSIADLQHGDLQGLVVQDPLRMGYLGVKTLVAHLQGQSVPDRIDTGVHMVTPDNMNEPENAQLLHPDLDKYLK